MDAPFSTIKLQKQQVLHEQVYEKVLQLVQSGQLQPGDKIPGSHKLAKLLDTNETTVHLALKKLTRDGWLNRVPKKGTYIAKEGRKLTCMGVYSYCGTTKSKESPYAHAVRQVLGEELRKMGIEMDLWMDSRPPDQFAEPWKPLVKAAEQRQFQGFIAIETNTDLNRWFQKLPVPISSTGAPASVQNTVEHDMRQFIEISLTEFARLGRRSVAFLAPIVKGGEGSALDGAQGINFDMLKNFTDVAGDLGLTVKNDWMRICRGGYPDPLRSEHFGYEEFLKLWNLSEKPDGLLVFDDVTARGALMAIRERHVRVPEDLVLLLHKNESIDLFCPMPATFVVADEREMARALIAQVQMQFRGESCERISLPFKLVAHDNR